MGNFLGEQKPDYGLATDRDFPDPTGIVAEGKFYAYSTSSGDFNIPFAVAQDNKNYQIIGEALPALPMWAEPSIWAPDIFYNGKEYVMYFAAKSKETQKRKIGFATSKSPKGPFKVSNQWIVSADEKGGLIDPEYFKDNDGKSYILYKSDGNSEGKVSEIWLQELSDDGLSIVGSPVSLLKNTDVLNPPNNGENKFATLVEAPCLVKSPEGKYVLFFSGNGYDNGRYFTGYAVSDNIRGPYHDVKSLISTNSQDEKDKIIGPGGMDVINENSNKSYALLHGWVNGYYPQNGKRALYIKNLSWKEGSIPQLN